MHLICSIAKTNRFLSHGLAGYGIKTIEIECARLVLNREAIDELHRQISKFDVIIITSPMLIEEVGWITLNAKPSTVFIVAGLASLQNLKSYTTNIILAPTTASGALAMIDEVFGKFDFNNRQVALLGSNKPEDKIHGYLKARLLKDSYTQISLYSQNMFDLNAEYIKKLLINDSLQGIILTSSSHARHLFKQSLQFGFIDELRNIDFFTLHRQIAETINQFGVKKRVWVSETASNQSLVDLIGKLHDRHDK